MEYKGKLYGKIGRKYVPLKLTSDDCDRMQDQLHSARYMLEETTPEKMAEITGLPLGVTVSAMENILSNEKRSCP